MTSSSEKILLLLLRQRQLSRADLAKAMRLSRPAVSSLVDALIRQRMLRESGCGASSGGKPPILLELEPHRFAAIGIDIGHESLLRGSVCDAAGTLIASRELPHDNRFETIWQRSAELAAQLRAATPLPVSGIGVAIAGQVNSDVNEVVYCGNFPLKGERLADKLSGLTGLPVLLDNRARTAAQWEYYFGAAQQTEDFIFISAERGIGTAIYSGGRLFRGRSGVAGEIRNLLVPSPDGASLLPIEQAMGEKFLLEYAGGKPDTPALVAAWRSREPGAVAAVDYLMRESIYVITLLTNLLDPALIVLGGRFRELGSEFAAELGERLTLQPVRKLECTLSHSGRIGAALGAALKIIIEQLKNDTNPNSQ